MVDDLNERLNEQQQEIHTFQVHAAEQLSAAVEHAVADTQRSADEQTAILRAQCGQQMNNLQVQIDSLKTNISVKETMLDDQAAEIHALKRKAVHSEKAAISSGEAAAALHDEVQHLSEEVSVLRRKLSAKTESEFKLRDLIKELSTDQSLRESWSSSKGVNDSNSNLLDEFVDGKYFGQTSPKMMSNSNGHSSGGSGGSGRVNPSVVAVANG
jgi:hypothetical protein